MPLQIETFSNVSGGNAFFKALTHPLAAEKAQALLGTLKAKGPVAIYDPLGLAGLAAQALPLAELAPGGFFVQDVERQDSTFAGQAAKLVTALPGCMARSLLIAAFDAARLAGQIRHLLPAGMGCILSTRCGCPMRC